MRINKEQIKKARLSLSLSQEDFGNLLGLSGSSVSMLERGETSPIDISEGDHDYYVWSAILSEDKDKLKNLPNPIAYWVKQERKKSKISINQLASKSGLTTHDIKAIERGELAKNISVIPKLEMAIGNKAPSNASETTLNNAIPGVGTLVDFNPHNIDERPLCSGIYVFYDISDRPIYVGESRNIRNRIKQHEEKFWFKSPLVEHAAYIDINDDKLRKGIEQILINFLRSNAVLNKQHVSRR